MGLVQSQSNTSEENDAIDVEGFRFTVEKNLKKFIPVYGNLIVDFRKTFFGDRFTVNFGRQSLC